jgi:hypothetical protein
MEGVLSSLVLLCALAPMRDALARVAAAERDRAASRSANSEMASSVRGPGYGWARLDRRLPDRSALAVSLSSALV